MPYETNIEKFAIDLHYSAKEAVEKGAVINKVPGQRFYEWNEITEEAREGRRIQARFLLNKYLVTPIE